MLAGPLSHLPNAHIALQLRIQRIIAERFLPILDDVFVAHKTHILRTTAISGGVTCIAGILGSKSVELKASGGVPYAGLLRAHQKAYCAVFQSSPM